MHENTFCDIVKVGVCLFKFFHSFIAPQHKVLSKNKKTCINSYYNFFSILKETEV